MLLDLIRRSFPASAIAADRANKRRKHARAGKTEPHRDDAPKDHRYLIAVLLVVVAAQIVFVGVYNYAGRAATDSELRRDYHLNEGQLRQLKQSDREHEATYAKLRAQAEQTRQGVETLLQEAKTITPQIRALFEQANREREACWNEEREHHRRVSQLMSAEDAQRFLMEKERLYAERKADGRGFLILPHD